MTPDQTWITDQSTLERRVTRTRRVLAIAWAALVLTLGLAEPALAQNIEGPLQGILDLLTGTIARLLAIISLVLIGVGAMFGNLDFRKAGIWIVGIIIVFGAAEIVDQVAGNG